MYFKSPNAVHNTVSNAQYSVAIISPMRHPSLDEAIEGFKETLESDSRIGTVKFIDLNADGDLSTIGLLTQRAVKSDPDIIFSLSTPATAEAAKIVGRSDIPLVFTAVTDPVTAGIVTRMDGSETNATGVTDRYPVKEQMALLIKMMPTVKKIAFLMNPSEQNSQILVKESMAELKLRGIESEKFEASDGSSVALVAKTAARSSDALVINGDNLFTNHIDDVIRVCLEDKKPLFVGDPDSVKKGAVCAVGPSYRSLGSESALKAIRILNGERASDIPTTHPTDFEYIINTDAATAFGINIPIDVIKSRAIWISPSNPNE